MKREFFGFFFSFRQTHHFFTFLVGVKNLGGVTFFFRGERKRDQSSLTGYFEEL